MARVRGCDLSAAACAERSRRGSGVARMRGLRPRGRIERASTWRRWARIARQLLHPPQRGERRDSQCQVVPLRPLGRALRIFEGEQGRVGQCGRAGRAGAPRAGEVGEHEGPLARRRVEGVRIARWRSSGCRGGIDHRGGGPEGRREVEEARVLLKWPQAGEEEEHGEERRWLARARKVSVPWQPVLSRSTP